MSSASGQQDGYTPPSGDEGARGEGRKRSWKRRVMGWLVWGLVALGVYVGVTVWQTRHLIEAGEEAPDFTRPMLSGETLSLSSLRGTPVVLEFWAPWCSACTRTAGQLEALHAELGDEVSVISVALGFEGLGQVRAFVEEHGVTYPVVLGNQALSEAYHIESYPTLYVLDREGRVVHRTLGFTTTLGLRARLALTD